MAVKWTGLDKVKKQVDALGKSVKNIGKHLRVSLPFFEGSVKRNITDGGRPKKFAPKADGTPATLRGRTGLLVAGINGRVEGNNIVIASPRVQSAILHFGGKTSAHIIRPRRAKALAFNVGGNTVFAKSVNHPGSRFPARPYMLIIEQDMNTGVRIIAESIAKEAGL